MKELNRLTSIDKIKPELINQYFRGELFILIDNLLTKKTSLYKDDHLKVMELFKAYIEAGIKFIHYSAENIKEVYHF